MKSINRVPVVHIILGAYFHSSNHFSTIVRINASAILDVAQLHKKSIKSCGWAQKVHKLTEMRGKGRETGGK